jgi:hypothetical protein
MFRTLFQTSDTDDAALLRRLSLTPGDQRTMERAILDVERRKGDTASVELSYELGIAFRNYTAWFVRGDDRVLLLRRAVRFLQRAYDASATDVPSRDDRALVDRFRIACALGMLLTDEACVRDLNTAVACLAPIYRSTRTYEPALCWYADALYKQGDYDAAAAVAMNLHQRALRSAEWRSAPPPAPLQLAAKAYRAAAKAAKKAGDRARAAQLFQAIVDLGLATNTDRRLLAALTE